MKKFKVHKLSVSDAYRQLDPTIKGVLEDWDKTEYFK
jgi:hypothetical protein